MSSETPPSISVLRAAASALFGIFLVSVILRAMPPQLLEPLWQLSFSTALLDMGGYALLGVVVLTIAQLLAPEEVSLRHQLGRVTRLCAPVALGYLLLVPLLFSALGRDYQRIERQSQLEQRNVDRMEQRLQQAIRSASSRDQLLRAVQRVNAPALGGYLISDAPLESQRSDALALLRSTAATARGQAAALSPASFPSVLLNNLRLVLLALVFAFGFSSAHTGFASFPLLHPLLGWLLELQDARSSRRQAAADAFQEQQYFESLAESDHQPPHP